MTWGLLVSGIAVMWAVALVFALALCRAGACEDKARLRALALMLRSVG